MPTGPEAFLEPPVVSELQPCSKTHIKKPCVTLVWLVRRTRKNDLLPEVEPECFRRTLLPAVLPLIFCIYVLFIQYICLTYFLFFCVFFLPQQKANPNSIGSEVSYLSFLRRVAEFSFVLLFSEKLITDFFLDAYFPYQVTIKRNFSFAFLTRPSIINPNTIDF